MPSPLPTKCRSSPSLRRSTLMRALGIPQATGPGSASHADDAIAFRWGASDDDLTYATLTNVPGPGAPSNDGPSSPSITAGTGRVVPWAKEPTTRSSPSTTTQVCLPAVKRLFIGIDRTGPTLCGPHRRVRTSTWQNSRNAVTVSVASSPAADDGQGSGVASCQFSTDGQHAWPTVITDAASTTFDFD